MFRRYQDSKQYQKYYTYSKQDRQIHNTNKTNLGMNIQGTYQGNIEPAWIETELVKWTNNSEKT